MPRFRLCQLYLPSLERYFLPLPKLTAAQVGLLSAHLEARGYAVRPGSAPGKRVALKGTRRIAIDGALGLATSGADMLDAVAPAIPGLLAHPGPVAKAGSDLATLYLSQKRSGASVQLQFFPRMESLRTWTCLRMDGLCGLTPDEKSVLEHVLGSGPGAPRLECVTAKPRRGSSPLRVGRTLYYSSAVPVAEFLSSLRTIDSGGGESASYLPKDSVIALPKARLDTRVTAEELGDWCFLDGGSADG